MQSGQPIWSSIEENENIYFDLSEHLHLNLDLKIWDDILSDL